jgi:hypothetical protein
MIYVGSSIDTLPKRLGKHKADCKSGKRISLYSYIKNNDWSNWYIEWYEDFPCNSKQELNRREGQVIREIGTINKQITGRTRKEYCEENADKIKKYYQNNSDKIKKYYEDNRDKIKAREKEYRENNADKIKEKKKKYREETVDREKEKARLKKYREDNADKEKARWKKYREDNRDKINRRRREMRKMKKNQ